MTLSPGPDLDAAAALAGAEIRGHVFDPAEPSRRFVVEILADGYPVGLVRAEADRPDLRARGLGDGGCGFAFPLSEALVETASLFEVRLANSDHPIGGPLVVGGMGAGAVPAPDGRVAWDTGLRLRGWLDLPPGADGPILRALVDGAVVAETRLTGWEHQLRGERLVPVRSFVLDLPPSLADGRVHRVEVLTDQGLVLEGSPCALVAFPEGLAAQLDAAAEIESERPLALLWDRLRPQVVPFSLTAEWLDRFPLVPPAGSSARRLAVILVGGPPEDAVIAALEAQEGVDWTAAVMASGPEGELSRGDLLAFLDTEAAQAQTVVLAPATSRFERGALAALDAGLAAHGEASLAYGDLLLRGEDGDCRPLAAPAFDRELCLERGYCTQVFAARASSLRAALAADVATLPGLFLAVLADAGARPEAAPVHCPGAFAGLPAGDLLPPPGALRQAVTAFLARTEPEARLKPGERRAGSLHLMRPRPPGSVAVVALVRTAAVDLDGFFDALGRTTGREPLDVTLTGPAAVLRSAAVGEAARRRGARLVEEPGPLRVSRSVNRAATAARGNHLLLIETDIRPEAAGWLDEMLSRLARPDTGAVAPLLLAPSGLVIEAGLVLGPGFDHAPAFAGRVVGDGGYADRLSAAHEVAAASGACLLVARELFLALGGWDDAWFPSDYGGIDFSLRLRAAGHALLVTPAAALVRHGTGGIVPRPDPRRHGLRIERERFRDRWAETLVRDPFYNPVLALDSVPYSGLAWPPRDRGPRQPSLPARPALHWPPALHGQPGSRP